MIKNKYTEKMNEIKAPQSAVENAVKAALAADKNRKEVITMPKKVERNDQNHFRCCGLYIVVTSVAIAFINI